MRTEMVERENKSLTLTRQCALLSITRTSIYYTPQTSERNKLLMDRIDELFTEDPTRGTRRLRAALRRQYGIEVGRSKIRSLMARMGLHAIYRVLNTSRPNKLHKKYPYLLRGVKIDRVNQVWSADITYIRLKGGFAYLCAVIDWYSRYVLSWRLSTTLDSAFCREALEEALTRYGTPEIFNTDQGCQFTSEEFTTVLLEKNIRISMDGKGRALDNVFVERLWRTVKYEDVYIRGYETVTECRSGLSEFFERYNTKREHSALLYNYPVEIYFGSVVLQEAA
jgi:putative transposase